MNQVSVRDSRGIRDDRRWLEGIYRDYLTDLAPSATGIFPALGEVGHREPDQLARWFADTQAHPVTILYGSERVGFAMVQQPSRPAVRETGVPSGDPAAPAEAGRSAISRDPAQFSMAEFFIVRSWRRRGIGAQAVRLILDRFTGQWMITEHVRNTAAVKFWRRVVAAYTDGKYQERIVNGEVQQRFASGSRRSR